MRSFRFTIARLMWVVLLFGLVSAAVAYPRPEWGGTVILLTRGCLCLALVGAICNAGRARAWWLGFFAFGWAYLAVSSNYYWADEPSLPTTAVLQAIAGLIGIGQRQPQGVPLLRSMWVAYFKIGNSLWTLLIGVGGGYLARAIFGVQAAQATTSAAETQRFTEVTLETKKWEVALPIALTSLSALALLAATRVPMDSPIVAGIVYLLTWGLFCLSALAALANGGRRREAWLGATFLGVGFLFLGFSRPPFESDVTELFLPTVDLLESVRPHFVLEGGVFAWAPNEAIATNARIRAALKQHVPMHLPEETTLEEVIEHVRKATRGADGKSIPIYVDPIGLQETEKRLMSTVKAMDLEGVTLATSLRLCLNQLDLVYQVHGDLLVITSVESEERESLWPNNDPYLVIGHCVLALMAAAGGAALAPLVCELSRKPSTTTFEST